MKKAPPALAGGDFMLVANCVQEPLHLRNELRRCIPAVWVWLRVDLADRLVSGVNCP